MFRKRVHINEIIKLFNDYCQTNYDVVDALEKRNAKLPYDKERLAVDQQDIKDYVKWFKRRGIDL